MERGGNCLWIRVDDRYAFKTPKEYGAALCGLSKWYFYNEAIISTTQKEYFVVFEKTSKIHRFSTEEKWKQFIGTNDLEPFIWTRWCDGDWTQRKISLFLVSGLKFVAFATFFLVG